MGSDCCQVTGKQLRLQLRVHQMDGGERGGRAGPSRSLHALRATRGRSHHFSGLQPSRLANEGLCNSVPFPSAPSCRHPQLGLVERGHTENAQRGCAAAKPPRTGSATPSDVAVISAQVR